MATVKMLLTRNPSPEVAPTTLADLEFSPSRYLFAVSNYGKEMIKINKI